MIGSRGPWLHYRGPKIERYRAIAVRDDMTLALAYDRRCEPWAMSGDGIPLVRALELPIPLPRATPGDTLHGVCDEPLLVGDWIAVATLSKGKFRRALFGDAWAWGRVVDGATHEPGDIFRFIFEPRRG
jgi:hypothetical protein